jgi:hypothetical protein
LHQTGRNDLVIPLRLCASARKIILSQRRKDAKSIEGGQEPAPKDFRGIFSLVLCLRQTGRNDLTIPLRLCASAREKKSNARKDAKGLPMVGRLACSSRVLVFVYPFVEVD